MSVRGAALGFAAALALAVAQPAHAIEGSTDSTTAFTVAVATGGPSGPELRCSGVLIEPSVVLSVRHCIAAIPSLEHVDCATDHFGELRVNPEELWVSAAPEVTTAGPWHRVERFVLPERTEVCGADIALLLLSEPVPGSEATPAEIVTSAAAFEGIVRAGVFGAAGYGVSRTGATDAGTRRARWDVPFRCVRGDPRNPCETQGGFTAPTELVSGAAVCAGDSGSGASDVITQKSVFAVLSRGSLGSGECGEGIYQRSDVWAWFLARPVIDAAEARGQAAPSWADALFVPPGSIASDGGFCRNDDECANPSRCLSADEGRSFVCSAPCGLGSECSDGFGCMQSNVGPWCFPGVSPKSEPESSGCSVDPGHDPRASVWVALFLLAGFTARRSRINRIE